jgi:hypothetical protein
MKQAFAVHDYSSPSTHLDVPHFEIVCECCDETLEVEVVIDIGVRLAQ